MSEIELIDGEEENRLHPNTFRIPPLSLRKSLTVGMYAKIGLRGDCGGERFWAQVERIDEDRYIGKIANKLVVIDAYEGDPIAFGPEHVLDWEQ